MANPRQGRPIFPGQRDDLAGREFISLYTRHARQLYRYIRILVPHQADAEDTFQEVSIVLWEKFGQFQRGTNFAAWASQIARYAVSNLRKYKRRTADHVPDDLFDAIADEALQIQDHLEAQHRALADCYQRLSAADRNLVDQRYRSGMTVKDLSEQIGRPSRTVYRLLDHIHAALLDCIELKLNRDSSHE